MGEGGGGDGRAEGEREGGQQFLEITQGAFGRLVNPLWKSGLSSLLGCFREENAAFLDKRPASICSVVRITSQKTTTYYFFKKLFFFLINVSNRLLVSGINFVKM